MKNLAINQSVYPFVAGIDVSKMSLDVCLVNCSSGQCVSTIVANNSEGFTALKKWLKSHGCDDHEKTLFCLEHTGIYTQNLVKYLLSRGGKVWVESSLHIKRSMGLVRGKTDKIDAERIARFAYLHQQEAKLVQLSHPTLQRLQYLMRARIRLIKSLNSHQTAIEEMSQVDKKAGTELARLCKKAVEGLKKSLQQVEAKMEELVSIDKEVRALYELITSVRSVGKVLAIELIVFTHGFSRLLDGKKLACYTGVAPFEYRSGTSVKGATGTSSFANKILKRTLFMASMNAIRHNGELKEYYLRKTAEGKSKMSVLNAVRNKLLHRIVAVVKRGTPFQDKLVKAD